MKASSVVSKCRACSQYSVPPTIMPRTIRTPRAMPKTRFLPPRRSAGVGGVGEVVHGCALLAGRYSLTERFGHWFVLELGLSFPLSMRFCRTRVWCMDTQAALSPEKRTQILEGAASVFAADGYEGASMARIAL